MPLMQMPSNLKKKLTRTTPADKSSRESSVDQDGTDILRVGDRVVLPMAQSCTNNGHEFGTVRWTGVLPDDDRKETTVGIEFDNPIGTGTGKYRNHRLFYSKYGHASLVPAIALIREENFCDSMSVPGESSQRPQVASSKNTARISSPDTCPQKQIPQDNDAKVHVPRDGDPGKSSLDKTVTDSEYKTIGLASLPAKCSAPNTKPDKHNVQAISVSETDTDNSSIGMLSVGDMEVQSDSAAVADFIPTERECSVCHEDFTEPKVLPCGHLLCRHCLISWMKTQREANCPLCRQQVVTQTEIKEMKLEDIADSFFTDHYMMTVIEAASVLSKQHACRVCVNVAAVSLCLTCGDMLCSSCTSVHEKLSATSHHNLEALDTLTPEQLAANRTVTCAVHSSIPSELFCQTHNIPICLPCARTDHRKCAELRYLEEQKEENQKLIADLTETLCAAETKLMQKLSQLEQHLVHIECIETTAVAHVDEECNRLTKAIQACQVHLRKQVHEKYFTEKSCLMEEKKSVLNERGKLTLHKQMLRRNRELPILDHANKLRRTMQRCVDGLDHLDEKEDQKPPHPLVTVDKEQLAKIKQDLSCLQIQ